MSAEHDRGDDLLGDILPLEPTARSVQRARRWVVAQCLDRGRGDLVDAAETGVSELVTNALLHAPGPITVRIRGTADHPRVEVTDTSPSPPRPLPPDTSSDDPLDALLSTVGRGLRILATSSVAWGAELRADGKVVWFEPSADPRDDVGDADLGGTILSVDGAVDGAVDRAVGGTDDPGGATDDVAVALRGVPADDLARFRRHYRELRRELRLLALAHADEYPQAERLSALFTDLDDGLGHAVEVAERGTDGRSDPRATVELRLSVPATARPAAARMIRLLDLADEFCDAARLLTLARTPHERDFARWFLSEVGAQAEGAEPRPWRPGEPLDEARYSSS